jgi:hypothetical protein
MKNYLIVAVIILLSACGQKLDGVYANDKGSIRYTFKSNKVIMEMYGTKTEMDYVVEDNKIKFVTPYGATVKDMLPDGSIELTPATVSKDVMMGSEQRIEATILRKQK